MRRFQKHKNDSQVIGHFALLGSSSVKAACKHVDEIYAQDSLTDAFKEGADVWTVFLGVVVTLLPRVSQK
jgi:hypothetical protein